MTAGIPATFCTYGAPCWLYSECKCGDDVRVDKVAEYLRKPDSEHVHGPIPGSVFDASGIWRPTAEQADPANYGVVFPLTARCECGRFIRRDPDEEWRLKL